VLAQVPHVGGHVEREAVHRAPVPEPHTDRADLARHDIGVVGVVEPHACEAGQPSGVRQPEFGECVDDQPLDAAHMGGCTEAVVDVENRVADQLAGSVIGDVAAPLDRYEFGVDGEGIAPQVGVEVGPRAVSEDVWVLEQQEVLAAAVLEQRGLEGERLAVRHAAEPART
jgi:hypothetical protein